MKLYFKSILVFLSVISLSKRCGASYDYYGWGGDSSFASSYDSGGSLGSYSYSDTSSLGLPGGLAPLVDPIYDVPLPLVDIAPLDYSYDNPFPLDTSSSSGTSRRSSTGSSGTPYVSSSAGSSGTPYISSGNSGTPFVSSGNSGTPFVSSGNSGTPFVSSGNSGTPFVSSGNSGTPFVSSGNSGTPFISSGNSGGSIFGSSTGGTNSNTGAGTVYNPYIPPNINTNYIPRNTQGTSTQGTGANGNPPFSPWSMFRFFARFLENTLPPFGQNPQFFPRRQTYGTRNLPYYARRSTVMPGYLPPSANALPYTPYPNYRSRASPLGYPYAAAMPYVDGVNPYVARYMPQFCAPSQQIPAIPTQLSAIPQLTRSIPIVAIPSSLATAAQSRAVFSPSIPSFGVPSSVGTLSQTTTTKTYTPAATITPAVVAIPTSRLVTIPLPAVYSNVASFPMIQQSLSQTVIPRIIPNFISGIPQYTGSNVIPSSLVPIFPQSNVRSFPSTNTGFIPSTNTGFIPSTNTGFIPSSNAGSFPSTNIGSFPSTNIGSFPSTNIGSFPSTNIGSFPSTKTGSFPSTNTGSIPSSGTGVFPVSSGSSQGNPTNNLSNPSDATDAIGRALSSIIRSLPANISAALSSVAYSPASNGK